MDKTIIVIGIGGIGCRVGADFAAGMAEKAHPVLCVAADTDDMDLKRYEGGRHIVTMPMSETLLLGQVTERLGENTLSAWFPPCSADGASGSSLSAADMVHGAGGYRAKGLLLLENFLGKDEARSEVLSAVDDFVRESLRLPVDAPAAPEAVPDSVSCADITSSEVVSAETAPVEAVSADAIPTEAVSAETAPVEAEPAAETQETDRPVIELYTVAGLGGGTGSALFTVLTAYVLQHLSDTFGRQVNMETRAYLMSPLDLSVPNTLLCCANAGAAMEELNAVMTGVPMKNGQAFRVGQDNDPRIGLVTGLRADGTPVFDRVTLLNTSPALRTVVKCAPVWSDTIQLDAEGVLNWQASPIAQGQYRTASLRKLLYRPELLCRSFGRRHMTRLCDTEWLPFISDEAAMWKSFLLYHTEEEADAYVPILNKRREEWPIFEKRSSGYEGLKRTIIRSVDSLTEAAWFDAMLPQGRAVRSSAAGREERKRKRADAKAKRPAREEIPRMSLKERIQYNKDNKRKAQELIRSVPSMLARYESDCLTALRALTEDENAFRNLLLDALKGEDGLYPHPIVVLTDLCGLAGRFAALDRGSSEARADEELFAKDMLLSDRECESWWRYSGGIRALRKAGVRWPLELRRHAEQCTDHVRADDLFIVADAVQRMREAISDRVERLWNTRMYEVVKKEIARFRKTLSGLPGAWKEFRAEEPELFADERNVGLTAERQNKLFRQFEQEYEQDEAVMRAEDDAAFRLMFGTDCSVERSALRSGLSAWISTAEERCKQAAWLKAERNKDIMTVLSEVPGAAGELLPRSPSAIGLATTSEAAEEGGGSAVPVTVYMSPASAQSLCRTTGTDDPAHALREVGAYDYHVSVHDAVPDNTVFTAACADGLLLEELPGLSVDGALTVSVGKALMNMRTYGTRMWNPYLAYICGEENETDL